MPAQAATNTDCPSDYPCPAPTENQPTKCADNTQELTDISPCSTTPWLTSKTTNECALFFFLYCELCIVQCVFYIACFVVQYAYTVHFM